MRNLVNWKDHVVEYPRRYREKDLGGGLVELDRDPGVVRQQGTPQNATNFNTMDLAAFEAMLIGNENTRMIMSIMDKLGGIVGERLQVTLKNTQAYPFNDSTATVKLPASRNTKDYTITPEVVSVSDGAAGDIEFSEKLLNGFKVHFTGSAKNVVLDLYVRGGV